MSRQRARVLTDSEREAAISAAREGMSLEGIAGLLRMSREAFRQMREREPELDADLMRAIAEYEMEHVKMLRSPDLDERAYAQKELARRFPLRHGTDAKLRIDPRRAIHDEAIADAPNIGAAAPSNDSATLEAIEAFLALKKSGGA